VSRSLIVFAVASIGVLLPKLTPAFIFPRDVPPAFSRWLTYLPAATLGSFTAVSATGLWSGSPGSPAVFAALGVAGVVAAITRQTFPALGAGWIALVGIHLAGLI